MSFVSLWAAALVAAAVIPALVLLYFLKLRRRQQVVSSTLLWRRAIQDLQVNAPFQRLRRNLLLLLQLLVLLLAILALARPIIHDVETQAAERMVLLIDHSGSMNAREEDGTRLEEAKEQARRLARTINRTGSRWFSFAGPRQPTEVMVVAFADRATIVTPFTTNMTDVLAGIDEIQPTDATTNLGEALTLAQAYLDRQATEGAADDAPTPARLVLFSDGGVTNQQELMLRHATAELRQVGQTGDNAAVTMLRAERNYERPEMVTGFIEVRNFAEQPADLKAALYVNGELIRDGVWDLSLAPATPLPDPNAGANAPAELLPAEQTARRLEFSLPLWDSAVLEARLLADDALPADNTAFVVIPPPRRLSVLLVTQGNALLQMVLNAQPLEQVVTMTPAQYEAAGDDALLSGERSQFDVVIFDRHDTDRLPPGNYLFLGGLPLVDDVTATGEAGTSPAVWYDESHPVLRHVALSYVRIASSRILEVHRTTQILAESPHGPLMVRFRRAGAEYLVTAFAIQDSDWWLRESFAVFFYNALRFLTSDGAGSTAEPVLAGQTATVRAAPAADEAEIIAPGDRRIRVTPNAAGLINFGQTQRAGLYRIEPGLPEHDRFAVQPAATAEGDIRPRSTLRIGTETVVSGGRIGLSNPEIWRWFVGAALVMLLIEWYIYTRRVAI